MLWLNCGHEGDGLYLLSLRFTSLVVELDALVMMVLPKGLGEN